MTLIVFVRNESDARSILQATTNTIPIFPTMSKDWDGEASRPYVWQLFAAAQIAGLVNLSGLDPFPIEADVFSEIARHHRHAPLDPKDIGVEIVT